MKTLPRLEIENLDEGWKVWAKCPMEGCGAVTHSCCSMHLRWEMESHIGDTHERLDADNG